MWKRDESENLENTRMAPPKVQVVPRQGGNGTETPPAAPAAAPAAAAPAAAVPSRPQASTIGESVVIKGQLTASEDLTIEGRVEGKIELKEHVLTIGSHGKIQAEVFAKEVVILGEVTGNVTATEIIDIHVNGSVTGDISAPRVSIEEGAYFRGNVDMQPKIDAIAARGNGGAEPESPRAQPELPRAQPESSRAQPESPRAQQESPPAEPQAVSP